MKKFIISTLTILILLISLTSFAKNDGRHLELSINITPTFVMDNSVEFFSQNTNSVMAHGADIKYEVGTISNVLHILPFISFRHNYSTGSPELSNSNSMDTTLKINELKAGLRLRGWFLSWLGAYVQAYGGVSFFDMSAKLTDISNTLIFDTYKANDTRWNAGAGIGLEFRISPERLKRKGTTKFNFGGEIGVGFIKRGTAKFKPKLSGGDEFSIKDINTTSFGTFDVSGVTMDIGVVLSFF